MCILDLQKTCSGNTGGGAFVVSLADLKSVKLRKADSNGSSSGESALSARRKSFHFGQR